MQTYDVITPFGETLEDVEADSPEVAVAIAIERFAGPPVKARPNRHDQIDASCTEEGCRHLRECVRFDQLPRGNAPR